MIQQALDAIGGILTSSGFANCSWQNLVMIAIACVLILSLIHICTIEYHLSRVAEGTGPVKPDNLPPAGVQGAKSCG